jgi:hypothetical protein
MEQLVLLLIIGAISLINWLIEQSGKRREKRQLEQKHLESDFEENPNDVTRPSPLSTSPTHQPIPGPDLRRMLEAFGIPTPEEISPQPIPQEPSQPTAQIIPQFEPRATVIAPKPKRQSALFVKPQISALNKSPHALRQAIVWSEILGTPRSLRPY